MGTQVIEVADAVRRESVIELMAAIFGTTRAALGFYDWLAENTRSGFAGAWSGRQLIGTAAAVCMGPTGWIGGIGVLDSVRGRGVGTDLTQWAIDWLEARGAMAQGLLASELGRPIYARMGFVAEGDMLTFAGSGGGPAHGVRPLDPRADGEQLRALFARAHGEPRDPLVNAAQSGWVIDAADGGLTGAALDCPWPLRPIAATTPVAGIALLDRARYADSDARFALPEANAAGCSALIARGFRVTQRTTRMLRGTPPPFRPDQVFCAFSLVTG